MPKRRRYVKLFMSDTFMNLRDCGTNCPAVACLFIPAFAKGFRTNLMKTEVIAFEGVLRYIKSAFMSLYRKLENAIQITIDKYEQMFYS